MAIDDPLDEREQSEQVLAWLRRNGAGLIGGVVLGFALIGGWQWWQRHQETSGLKAADEYQTLLQRIDAKDLKRASGAATSLAGTPYGTLAALDLAKAQVDAGQQDAAIKTLQGVTDVGSGLQPIVSQRLARLQLDAGKPQDALRTLGTSEDAASLEVRGDVQLTLGKRDEARKAYSAALAKMDEAAPQRRLLQLKFTEAGGTSVDTSVQSEART